MARLFRQGIRGVCVPHSLPVGSYPRTDRGIRTDASLIEHILPNSFIPPANHNRNNLKYDSRGHYTPRSHF